MKKFSLFLLCLWAQTAWAQVPLPVSMDSLQIKRLARLACPCFKEMAQLFPEKLADDVEMQQGMDKKMMDGMRKNLECLMEQMREHKKELGMEHIPDSLLTVDGNIDSRPPAFIRNLPMSTMLYAVRDCPYFFNGLKAALDFAQITQKKQFERLQAMEKDTAIAKVEEVAQPEYYENPYQKRFKGKIKGLDAKNTPALVIERMIDGKKVTDKPLILYQLSEGEDILRNIDQYKGKEVIVETNTSSVFNPKTKQFEQCWYLRSITVSQ